MDKISKPKRLLEIDLSNFCVQNPKKFVELCETQYEKRIEIIAKDILASKKPIVTLTGPSSSGKTTSSHKLAQKLIELGKPAIVISMDNFFLGKKNYPTLPDGTKDLESPKTLNMEEIHTAVSTLCKTGEVELPIFDFKEQERSDEKKHVKLNDGICILEGIHAFNPALISLLKQEGVYQVYVSVREEYSVNGIRSIETRNLRLCRRMLRDMDTRGLSPEKTVSLWKNIVSGEDKYIKPYKHNADAILDTAFTYEIHLVAHLMKQAPNLTATGSIAWSVIKTLNNRLDIVSPLSMEYLPKNSMLREFYG